MRVTIYALILVIAGLAAPVFAQDSDHDGVDDLSDNCPAAFNPGQEDNGGLGSAGPDGNGDVCQCGDTSDDGVIDLVDPTRLSRQLASLGPALTPAGLAKCRVDGNGVCNSGDVQRVREVLAGIPVSISNTCEGAAPPLITIDSPVLGEFTTLSSIQVTGTVANVEAAFASVDVNGALVAIQPDLSFSTTLPLDPNGLFQRILAEVTVPSTGGTGRDLHTIVSGDSTPDGDVSPMSVALRINDSGFDQIEPALGSLVPLDPSALGIVGTTLVENYCLLNIFVCVWEVDVVATDASFGPFSIDIDSMTDQVAGDIVIDDLFIEADVVGAGCSIQLTSDTTTILGDYALSPDMVDPNSIDVNQVGGVNVSLSAFNDSYDCGFILIDLVVGLFVGNIEPQVVAGFQNFLNDPDGAGPVDGPVADAIEVALAGVQLSGPIGDAIGVSLETPMADIFEDIEGITLDSDARITASMPDPNAPDLLASYELFEPFPTFSMLTPGGLPYDVGLCLGSSAFNQLLKAEVESGLLTSEIAEIDFAGSILPVTAGLLGVFIPSFQQFDPTTMLLIRVRPALAPIVTGELGPAGEIAELAIGHLVFEVVNALPPEISYLSALVEFSSGLEFMFDPNGALEPTLSPPTLGSLDVALLENPIGANEALVQGTLGIVLPPLLPSVAGALGSIPLPAFLGLDTDGIEIAREGSFLSVYLDLNTPLP